MVHSFLKRIFLFTLIILWQHNACASVVYPEIKKLEGYYKEVGNKHKKEIRIIIEKYKDDPEFNFQLGKLFMNMSMPLDAEIIFKKLYDEQPKDKYEISYGQALLAQYKFQEILYVVKLNALSDALKAYKYLLHAHALFGLEKKYQALDAVNEALSLIPYNYNMLTLKARILTSLNKTQESLELLKKLEETDIDPVRIYTLQAENYIIRKEYLRAKELYDNMLIKDNTYSDAYFGRAKVSLLMQRPEDALTDGIALLTKDPDNPFGTFIIASALNAQKKYTEAFKLYDGRGDTANFFLPGLLLEAEINFNNKYYDRARILLNKYLKIDFYNAKALKIKGILKLQEGNSHDALGYLQNAHTLDSEDPDILVALSYAYYDTGRYDEAEDLYRQISIKFPEFKYISDNAFALACKLKTVKIEQKSLCSNPQQSEIAEQIFDSFKMIYVGNTQKALDTMKKLIRVYKNSILAQKHYAILLNNYDDPDKAVAILFNVLKQDPENQEILSELYAIYKSGKSSVNILDKMQNIFENDKNTINAGYYLANFFYKNKNYDKAFNVMQSMLERAPENVDLYEMILKIIIMQPEKFSSQIIQYLAAYQKLHHNNPILIRLLRQNIMQLQFKKTIFASLDLPFGEKSPKDYQVYAEYLNFVNNVKSADIIYKSGMKKFSTDFNFYNSAFDFYKNDKAMLLKLKNSFTNKNKNYNAVLQAKLYVAQNQLKQAGDLLIKRFQSDKHGLVASLLLTIQPTSKNINLVKEYFEGIIEYKYEATFSLAQCLYDTQKFDEASTLLNPFYSKKSNDVAYQFLVSKVAFYTNFSIANSMMQNLIQKFPYNKTFLMQMLPFEVKNKNYGQAIALFEEMKPNIKDNPSIYFYYAYALLEVKREQEALKILNTLITSKQPFYEKNQAVNLLKAHTKNQDRHNEGAA